MILASNVLNFSGEPMRPDNADGGNGDIDRVVPPACWGNNKGVAVFDFGVPALNNKGER